MEYVIDYWLILIKIIQNYLSFIGGLKIALSPRPARSPSYCFRNHATVSITMEYNFSSLQPVMYRYHQFIELKTNLEHNDQQQVAVLESITAYLRKSDKDSVVAFLYVK